MTWTIIKPITAEALFEMGDIGRCELVRGEIISPSSEIVTPWMDVLDQALTVTRLFKPCGRWSE